MAGWRCCLPPSRSHVACDDGKCAIVVSLAARFCGRCHVLTCGSQWMWNDGRCAMVVSGAKNAGKGALLNSVFQVSTKSCLQPPWRPSADLSATLHSALRQVHRPLSPQLCLSGADRVTVRTFTPQASHCTVVRRIDVWISHLQACLPGGDQKRRLPRRDNARNRDVRAPPLLLLLLRASRFAAARARPPRAGRHQRHGGGGGRGALAAGPRGGLLPNS